MEDLIKEIEKRVKNQGGLTIEDLAELESLVIEEMIKVEAISEMIREQVLVDPAAEEAESEDNSNQKIETAKEITEDIERGLTDTQLKNKYTKNQLIEVATQLEVADKVEKTTQQGYIDAIRKAVA